jgi:hypothetical protein
VVPFDPAQAEAAQAVPGRWDFAENPRDTPSGRSPKSGGAMMVAENKKHLSWLPEVRTPRDMMK